VLVTGRRMRIHAALQRRPLTPAACLIDPLDPLDANERQRGLCGSFWLHPWKGAPR
jgi:hypothetical protein